MAGMKNIPPVQSHQAARKAKVRCNVTLMSLRDIICLKTTVGDLEKQATRL